MAMKSCELVSKQLALHADTPSYPKTITHTRAQSASWTTASVKGRVQRLFKETRTRERRNTQNGTGSSTALFIATPLNVISLSDMYSVQLYIPMSTK